MFAKFVTAAFYLFAVLLILPVVLAVVRMASWGIVAPWSLLSVLDWLVLLSIATVTIFAQVVFLAFVIAYKEMAFMRLLVLPVVWVAITLMKVALLAIGVDWAGSIPWVSIGEFSGSLVAIVVLPLNLGIGLMGGYVDGHALVGENWCGAARFISASLGYDVSDVGLWQGIRLSWNILFSETAGELMLQERLSRPFFDFDLRGSFSGAYHLMRFSHGIGCFAA